MPTELVHEFIMAEGETGMSDLMDDLDLERLMTLVMRKT